eukprot:1902989-Rhodomonas_salina.2
MVPGKEVQGKIDSPPVVGQPEYEYEKEREQLEVEHIGARVKQTVPPGVHVDVYRPVTGCPLLKC